MNSPLAVLLAVAVGIGVLPLWFWGLDRIRRRWRKVPQPTHELIVLCRDDSSFSGVELRTDSAGILLAAPRLLPDDGPPVKLEGDLRIPADNIRAVQIVTGHEALREPALGLRTERQGRG